MDLLEPQNCDQLEFATFADTHLLPLVAGAVFGHGTPSVQDRRLTPLRQGFWLGYLHTAGVLFDHDDYAAFANACSKSAAEVLTADEAVALVRDAYRLGVQTAVDELESDLS